MNKKVNYVLVSYQNSYFGIEIMLFYVYDNYLNKGFKKILTYNSLKIESFYAKNHQQALEKLRKMYENEVKTAYNGIPIIAMSFIEGMPYFLKNNKETELLN